jgi:hypothetical protein
MVSGFMVIGQRLVRRVVPRQKRQKSDELELGNECRSGTRIFLTGNEAGGFGADEGGTDERGGLDWQFPWFIEVSLVIPSFMISQN